MLYTLELLDKKHVNFDQGLDLLIVPWGNRGENQEKPEKIQETYKQTRQIKETSLRHLFKQSSNIRTTDPNFGKTSLAQSPKSFKSWMNQQGYSGYQQIAERHRDKDHPLAMPRGIFSGMAREHVVNHQTRVPSHVQIDIHPTRRIVYLRVVQGIFWGHFVCVCEYVCVCVRLFWKDVGETKT